MIKIITTGKTYSNSVRKHATKIAPIDNKTSLFLVYLFIFI